MYASTYASWKDDPAAENALLYVGMLYVCSITTWLWKRSNRDPFLISTLNPKDAIVIDCPTASCDNFSELTRYINEPSSQRKSKHRFCSLSLNRVDESSPFLFIHSKETVTSSEHQCARQALVWCTTWAKSIRRKDKNVWFYVVWW